MSNTFMRALITIIILLPLTIHGQKKSVPNHFETSFALTSNLIIIKASIGGNEGNFILDTGTPGLVLNQNISTEMGQSANMHTISAREVHSYKRIVQLQLGPWKLRHSLASFINMDHLESKLGIPLSGFIGIQCLKPFEILIDYRKSAITFHKTNRKGELIDALQNSHVLKPDTIPFTFRNHLPFVSAQKGNKHFRFLLDTGAAVNLFKEGCIGIIPNSGRLVDFSLVGMTAKSRNANQILCQSILQLGRHTTARMNTVVCKKGQTKKYLESIFAQGVLGFPFLAQQKIAINFRKREIYLWSIREKEIKYIFHNVICRQ